MGDRGLGLEALKVILAGQSPPFEGRRRGAMGEAVWFESAEELVFAGVDYFGPVARKRERPLAGFTKADVADTTNVVWLDLDPPATITSPDRSVLVSEAERRLEECVAVGLAPTVFLFSGRGCWAYWKLDRSIAQAEAELIMRRLCVLFRREGSEWDIGRIARMPGSVNEKSGLESFVMAVEDVRWSPEELGSLLPELDEQAPRPSAGEAGLRLQPSGSLPPLMLTGELAEYARTRPDAAERKRLSVDGSRSEQRIIALLVNDGASDGDIAVFFDHNRLPRHSEERRRRGDYSWLARGISRARSSSSPSPAPESVSSSPSLLSLCGFSGFRCRS